MAKKKKSNKKTVKRPQKPTPVVLSINVCDSIIRDEITKKVSLIGIFNTIHANSFPAIHPLLHVYMALTNGHGKYKGELRLLDDAGKVLVSAQGPLEFSNPLQVVEINFQWQQLKFAKQGQYIIEVQCDGGQVGSRKFRVIGPTLRPTSGTEVE